MIKKLRYWFDRNILRRRGTMSVAIKLFRADGTVEDLGVVSKTASNRWRATKGK